MSDFLFAHGSYMLIFVVLVLTGAGLPLPEEVPIIVAGVLSANDPPTMIPWVAFLVCLAGAVIGDCIMYFLGYHFGRGLLKDHRWWARLLTPEREAKIEEQFRIHGLGVFFVARFLVGVRGPVYLTAGILRVSFRRFLVIDLLCAAVVVGTVFGLSYLFGSQIQNWIKVGQIFLTVAVVLLVLAIGVFLWRRHLKKKQEKEGDVKKPTEPDNA
jgi:membrane protein DedA with SNARE-associated domain